MNRYERKKNIGLAIESFAQLVKTSPDKSQQFKLVVAGGYDPLVMENIEHRQELEDLAKKLGISERVVFLTSISNELRRALLKNATCVLYTPAN